MEHDRRSSDSVAFLQLLGGFQMRIGSVVVEVPEASQRILVYLALQTRASARARVAGELWPSKTEARAAANLRSAIWRVPKVEGRSLIDARTTSLAIAPWVTIDTRECERVGWALVRGHGGPLEDDAKALFLEELLPGWYDDWIAIERERMSQLQLHFLEALSTAYLASGRYADAMDTSVRLVGADPLRERSQRMLMAVHIAEGNPAAASRQLDDYRKLLGATFGCAPSELLVSMVTRAIGSNTPSDLGAFAAGLRP